MKGSQYAAKLAALSWNSPARRKLIQDAVAAGDVYFGGWCLIDTPAGPIQVSCDYVSLGTPDDFIRVPMGGADAQYVADAFDSLIATPLISDLIWQNASVRLTPQPMGKLPGSTQEKFYNGEMMSGKAAVLHNQWVETQRAGRQGLLAGHKKDVVISERLAQKPGSVAIYGWHKADGQPIQTQNTPDKASTAHQLDYHDYSHGVRLVQNASAIEPAYLSGALNFVPLQVARYPLPGKAPPAAPSGPAKPPAKPGPATPTPAPSSGSNQHLWARNIIQQAWPKGEPAPTLSELQYAQAVALGESTYGKGFGYHNWGAVQCKNAAPPCKPGCKLHKGANRCMLVYPNDLAGAADFIRIMFKRPLVVQAMRSGDLDAFVTAMGTPPVYSELAWQKPDVYRQWILTHATAMANALGEPLVIDDGPGGPALPPFAEPQVPRPEKSGTHPVVIAAGIITIVGGAAAAIKAMKG